MERPQLLAQRCALEFVPPPCQAITLLSPVEKDHLSCSKAAALTQHKLPKRPFAIKRVDDVQLCLSLSQARV